MLNNFTNPRPIFFGLDGRTPLAAGRLQYYEAGTSTPKEVYEDANGATSLGVSIILDAAGMIEDTGVWLGEGRYKVIVQASNGAGGYTSLYTVDNIPGSATVVSVLNTTAVSNIEDMKSVDIGLYSLVYVEGYYDFKDSGGGWFKYDDTSTAPDNLGTVFDKVIPTATGRWLRIDTGMEYSAEMFGATSSVADSSGRLLKLLEASQDDSKDIYINNNIYSISSSVVFTGTPEVTIENGATFNSTISGTTVKFANSALNYTNKTPIISGECKLAIDTDALTNCFIEWWGVSPTGVESLQKALNILTNGVLILSKTYVFSSQSSFVANVNLGKIKFETGATIEASGNINLNIDEYTTEAGVGKCFKSPGNCFFTSGIIDLKHFYLGTSGAGGTSVEPDLWLQAGKMMAQSSAVVEWSGDETYAFINSGQLGLPLANPIRTINMRGAILKAIGAADLGRIECGNYRVFSVDTLTNKFSFETSTARPEWFEAYPNDRDTLTPASSFVKLAEMQYHNSNGGVVWKISGNNNTYHLDEPLTINSSMIIEDVGLVNGQTANTVYLPGGSITEWTNCKIMSSGNSLIALTAIASNVTMRDCYIETFNDAEAGIYLTTGAVFSGTRLYFDAEKIVADSSTLCLTDSTIIGKDAESMVDMSEFSISNITNTTFTGPNGTDVTLACARGIISGNRFTNVDGVFYMNQGNIQNNVFIGSKLSLINVRDSIVSNNIFTDGYKASYISIGANSSLFYTIVNTQILNNSFFSSLSPTDTITVSDVLSEFGHIVKIVDNSQTGYTFNKSTEVKGRVQNINSSYGFQLSLTNLYLLPHSDQGISTTGAIMNNQDDRTVSVFTDTFPTIRFEYSGTVGNTTYLVFKSTVSDINVGSSFTP